MSRLYQAHMWCQQELEFAMEGNYDRLVISNTTTTEKEIQPYLDLAKKYDYRVVSLIVENRHGNESVHNVPIEVIDKMKDRFSMKL